MATQADRRAATQAAILKAARKLFGEDGFQQTTMDDIAAAARVAKGAVYHHFKTKEAVFEAVFDEVSHDLVAEIDKVSRAEKDVLAGDGRRHAALSRGLLEGRDRPDHPARRPGRARLGALARDRRAAFRRQDSARAAKRRWSAA